MNHTPILERFLVDCHTSISDGSAAGVKAKPPGRLCPWATNDDDLSAKSDHQARDARNARGLSRMSIIDESRSAGCRNRLHVPPTFSPLPPSTANSCALAPGELSYPPTAVTTRVEGSMTPSEQAAFEARIAALEAEMAEERQKRTVVQSQLQALMSQRTVVRPGGELNSPTARATRDGRSQTGEAARTRLQRQSLAPATLGNARGGRKPQ
eukprot:jgi/Ulvmu1/4993/UM021_0010.1